MVKQDYSYNLKRDTDKMILRIQTRDGMKRVEVGLTDTVAKLYEKVADDLKLDLNGCVLFQDRGATKEITRHGRKTIKAMQLRNGDILYLQETKNHAITNNSSSGSGTSITQDKISETLITNHKNRVETIVKEDDIDVLLSKETGLIPRKRDPQLCRHGAQGKCLHCSPLEPYDEEYLKTLNPPAKHMAFHSYLKKLKSGISKGKYTSMEDVNCKVKPGCTEHPPWPKGICTKCQPGAVILNRQKYRHVDNIMFENPMMMDRFLNYWRGSGGQRIGYLYGRYEQHDNVPLGIRATVAGIYEPPQTCSRDHIELTTDPNERIVEQLADSLGLRRVGWMFTDLVPDEEKSGQVKYLRHKDTHFLSAQETIMAADYQNNFPNPCKDSPVGKFGSKFVTVVVSGDEDQHIHYDGWQVSNQCMALVRDDCLVPTIDDPALGYVKESSPEQFVPDVFFKEKDTYGNEVTKDSRPMPIEYFLIEVPAGFPLEPLNTFIGLPDRPFPIENRMDLGETQSFNSLVDYLHGNLDSKKLMEAFLDFHFLIYIATNDMLPVREKIGELCKALKSRDEELFQVWLHSEEWKTVEQMIHAHAPSPPPSASTRSPFSDVSRQRSGSTGSVELMDTDSSAVEMWSCAHCTFQNPSILQSCDMCGLPRN